jgi:hypothetical protein
VGSVHRRKNSLWIHFKDDNKMMLTRFHADLAMLGARPRRQHDTRRTFISLCLEDGARWDMLPWITHARPKSGLDRRLHEPHLEASLR